MENAQHSVFGSQADRRDRCGAANKGWDNMPEWPREKLLKHGPDLPMAERIRRYQENIRTIRASGCTVPTTAMIDSLDPAEIELWFTDNAFNIDRLKKVIVKIADLPPEAEIPSLLVRTGKSSGSEQ